MSGTGSPIKKKVAPPADTKNDPNALRLMEEPGRTWEQTFARVVVRPAVNAATSIRYATKGRFETVDFTSLVSELDAQASVVNQGNLERSEAMLIAQAHTLDALFAALTTNSFLNMKENLSAAETFMRLALKAQSQCRATHETLAQIKNPPGVAFVKQANIANGPQQVNNGIPPPCADPRAREIFPENKLLEPSSEERLDIGTASTPTRSNPALETVGAIDRAAHE